MHTLQKNMKKASRALDNVAKFIYLWTVTNQNLIHEEIKRRLHMGNACYHSVSEPFRLLICCLKTLKYTKSAVLPLLCMGMKSDLWLRVFENGVLRGIFGPKSDEVIGNWRKLLNEEVRNWYPLTKYNCNDQVKEDEMGRACSAHRWEE
jgi:hypothetical protein